VLLLIPLFPFLGFLVNAFVGRRLPKAVSGAVACVSVAAGGCFSPQPASESASPTAITASAVTAPDAELFIASVPRSRTNIESRYIVESLSTRQEH